MWFIEFNNNNVKLLYISFQPLYLLYHATEVCEGPCPSAVAVAPPSALFSLTSLPATPPPTTPSLFLTVVLAYLALLLLWAENFSSMWSPLPPLALSFIRLFFLLRPSTLILLPPALLSAAFASLAPPLLFFFFARFSWFFLFSISMASLSGDRNLNH